MALRYDSFGIRQVHLEADIWPALDGFVSGDLGRLFGALNGDEIFTSSEIRPQIGATFDGEHWSYDLMQSSVLIRCRGFETPERLQSQIRSLLDGTRRFFQDRGVV
ncbi:MAG: hypothetical protein ACYCX7_04320, partial [Solirubrobacteraceae bacterium]